MSNKIVQHCCVASCNAYVARITTLREKKFFVADSRKSLYFVQISTSNICTATCNATMLREELHDFVARTYLHEALSTVCNKENLFRAP